MRNIMPGFAVLGVLAVGIGAPATAHTLFVLPADLRPPALERVDCGPHCWEHRSEVREREAARHRWAEAHQFGYRPGD